MRSVKRDKANEEKNEIRALDLKPIELSDNSGNIKTSPYATDVKLGLKSTELELGTKKYS